MPITTYPVTVAHEELEGSPMESGDASKFTATRELKCAWADRLTLFDQLLLGYEITIGAPGLGNITTTCGQQYPHRPGVYVKSVSIAPFSNKSSAFQGDTKIAAWTHAKLTVQYEPGNFDPSAGSATSGLAAGVAEESLDPSVMILQPPDAATNPVYLDNAGHTGRALIPGNNRPGILVRTMVWSYSLTRVKTMPPGWETYQGYVNSATVTSTSLGRTFAPETLLFNGPKSRRSFNGSGTIFSTPGLVLAQSTRAWDCVLQFTWNPNGWNYFPDSSGVFYQLYSAASGGSVRKPYPNSADFTSVLNL